MLGSAFAGTEEAPGEVVFKSVLVPESQKIVKVPFKVFRGMASIGAVRDRLDLEDADPRELEAIGAEGIEVSVPAKGSARAVIQEMLKHLCSAISYGGATSLADLQDRFRKRRRITSSSSPKPRARSRSSAERVRRASAAPIDSDIRRDRERHGGAEHGGRGARVQHGGGRRAAANRTALPVVAPLAAVVGHGAEQVVRPAEHRLVRLLRVEQPALHVSIGCPRGERRHTEHPAAAADDQVADRPFGGGQDGIGDELRRIHRRHRLRLDTHVRARLLEEWRIDARRLDERHRDRGAFCLEFHPQRVGESLDARAWQRSSCPAAGSPDRRARCRR